MKLEELKIIGSEEWCSFETFGIPAIKARVDSGAKTSSIQANNITIFYKETVKWVRFVIYPLQLDRSVSVICEAKVHAKRSVKSSMGISEDRLVIKTHITIANDTFDIEVTLANRDSMEFKMLLGREALSNRYLINSSTAFLLQQYIQEDIDTKYAAFPREVQE